MSQSSLFVKCNCLQLFSMVDCPFEMYCKRLPLCPFHHLLPHRPNCSLSIRPKQCISRNSERKTFVHFFSPLSLVNFEYWVHMKKLYLVQGHAAFSCRNLILKGQENHHLWHSKCSQYIRPTKTIILIKVYSVRRIHCQGLTILMLFLWWVEWVFLSRWRAYGRWLTLCSC